MENPYIQVAGDAPVSFSSSSEEFPAFPVEWNFNNGLENCTGIMGTVTSLYVLLVSPVNPHSKFSHYYQFATSLNNYNHEIFPASTVSGLKTDGNFFYPCRIEYNEKAADLSELFEILGLKEGLPRFERTVLIAYPNYELANMALDGVIKPLEIPLHILEHQAPGFFMN